MNPSFFTNKRAFAKNMKNVDMMYMNIVSNRVNLTDKVNYL